MGTRHAGRGDVLSASPEFAPRLEKYDLLGEIGHGGMATVYRALDKRLGREVAVKIIHRHLRESREVAQRFQSEARAVAKLKHPNIVEVYDVSDAHEEERYLVVELVRGTTLRRLLAEQGSLPPEIAAAIGVEIAEALEHAHQLGVVHRDVKPENVLVADPVHTQTSPDRDPVDVKITDFGIAKLLDAQGVTSTGQVLGSPAHMAPEQIEGGDVTPRADVFGLGVLLYESMVGRLPFDGKNPAQVLRRVLEGQFTPADRAEPRVGSTYSEILNRALAHDASQRYASAAELAAALRKELVALGIEVPRRELHAFLLDPKGYRERHEPLIVDRLTARGRTATSHRDVPLAAACFNRALAYRPDDRELLASVSRLSRQARLRVAARRGALAFGGAAVVMGAALLTVRRPAPAPDAPPASSAIQGRPVASAHVTGPATALTARPESSALAATVIEASTPPGDASAPPLAPSADAPGPAAPSGSEERERPTAPRPDPEPSRPAPEPRATASASAREGEPPPLARVRILVDGPQNALVRIDGAEISWFGKIQELSAGMHTFEFIPPDDRCCEKGQTLRIDVRPSEGPNDVQTVRGRIEFRPAILDLRGPAGSTASCGPLGAFPVPGQQAITMTTPLLRVSCQLLPPPGSSEPPKEFDVTLKPGRLSTNLGQ
ncbi:MAG TPA: protein kinase [Polyangiaceae bacterium]|nr:protein kinase [Polyangiaceae bacterium]